MIGLFFFISATDQREIIYACAQESAGISVGDSLHQAHTFSGPAQTEQQTGPIA
jgi:hypothetical protein